MCVCICVSVSLAQIEKQTDAKGTETLSVLGIEKCLSLMMQCRVNSDSVCMSPHVLCTVRNIGGSEKQQVGTSAVNMQTSWKLSKGG